MPQESGLTSQEAGRRLEKYGKNELTRANKVNPLKIFFSQFASPLMLILVIAAIASWAIGFLPGQKSNIIDAILILVIVFASGISGFFQDYKAEKTIEALQRMATPKARVIRNGKETELDITEIVPGDLILVESGDIVPADARLLSSFNLQVDESVLTGESQSVEKKTSDEIFMHASVYVGRARALVLRTGMETKIGEIAANLQEMKEEKTPFQAEMSRFSKKIFWAVTAVTIILFLISLTKYGLYLSLLIAISLAVAAIPEGLPAVIALALAIGAKAMAKKNALIRKLAVTESIGAVDIICTDKTGTLTKNEMAVTRLFLNNRIFAVPQISKDEIKEIKPLLVCGALCNNSTIGYNEDGTKKYLGDQTEVAIRKISEKFGFAKEDLEQECTRTNEMVFTSKRKMMSVVCECGAGSPEYTVYSKGAPEVILKKCNRIYQNGKIIKLTKTLREEILKENENLAFQSLRVLGFAFKETKNPKIGAEENLCWLGLEAMIDPPRPEVRQALEDCKTAGIRVIMVTGDNPSTAKAIANEIGLESNGIMQGKDLDQVSDKVLKEKLNSGINIFARISPFHKLRILEILKKNNRVAMTGDGVNDALALKKADVGIAMGVNGTEVVKEASDMILLGDNFATIPVAIKEGRRIFDNIRKFVNYLFVCNIAEVAVLFLATLFLTLDKPIILPVQILWINLLTDGFPALALGIDPARPNIMRNPPRKKDEPIINKRLGWLIGVMGAKKTIVLFATFFLVLPLGVEVARTALFTGFVLYEFVRIGSIRYQDNLGWFSNKWLIAALAGSVLLQLLIIYSPLNVFFHIVPLGLYEWLVLIGGVTIGYILAIFITKIVMQFVKD